MFCKIITPLAFLTLILNAAYSQITFEKIYGGDLIDRAYSVEQSMDGGYITAGTSQLNNYEFADIMIVKFDQFGNIQWSKEIDRRYIDIADKIIRTNDGNYVISGLCGESIYDRSGFLIKLNQYGDTMWCKEYEYFDWNKVDVVQSNDGTYALLGSTNSLGAGWSDIIFTKVDQNGNEIVTKTYGGTENDHGNSINITNDEGFIITGTVDSFNSFQQDIYIVRTNANGDTLWTLNHGEPLSSEVGNDGKQLLGGDFIATGLTVVSASGLYHVYLVRISSSGNILWSKTYESVESQYGQAIIQTLDGGFAIAGYGWNNNMDVYLIKTDEIGDTIWTRWYGGNYTDYVYSLQQTPDNGFIISGCYQLIEDPLIDAYLIKTDFNGLINPVYIHEMFDINEITVDPNPLIEKGTIKIAIKKAGSLNISLYDLSGLKIKTIFNENVQPGELSLIFNIRNLPSGVYYINLRIEEKTILKKIVKI